MTGLAKFMLNCTRDVSMLGAKKMLEALNVDSRMIQAPNDLSSCSISMPACGMPQVQSPMSMLEAFYPVYWLKLASGLMGRLEGARPDMTTMSVLDRTPSVLNAFSPQQSPPRTVASAPATGWGPMP